MAQIEHNNSNIQLSRKLFRKQSKENIIRLKSLKNCHFKLGQNPNLTIVLCQGCQAKCTSCFRIPDTPEVMNLELLKHLLAYASKHFYSVSITGGEPLEYIDQIVEATNKFKNLRINITTNGERLKHSVLNQLKNNTNLYPIISLNGIDERHDESRYSGSFKEVIKGIECLNNEQIPFGILSVINKTNINQFLTDELTKFIEKIGACTFEVIQYYPIGISEAYCRNLILSDKEMTKSIEYRNELFKSNPYNFLFNASQLNSKRCQRELQVFIDGTVSYCPFSAWGFEKIQLSDTDVDIKNKLNKHIDKWNDLILDSSSFCPLQSNTKSYIDFFTKNGSNLTNPTGILDKNSEIHKIYSLSKT